METDSRNQPKHRSARYLAILIGIAILGALFILGLVPKLNNNHQINEEAKEAASEPPEVQIVRPKLAADASLLLPATTQTLADTAIQSRTTGYVDKIFVDIGAKVRKGQLLAIVESPDVDQQYNQASADTERSQATVGQSVADLERSKASADESHSDLARQAAAVEQAQSSYESALAKVEQALAAQATAEARLTQSRHSLDTQKADLAQAQAQSELGKVTANRYATLLKEGFVAQQDYDQAATTYKTTTATVEAAQASVAGAESDVAANEKSVQASIDTVKSARSDADAAKANVKANQEYYRSLVSAEKAASAGVRESQATIAANQAAVRSSAANQQHYGVLQSFEKIVAPFDGVITARNVNSGSLVSPGAINTASIQNTTPNVGLFGIARDDLLVIYVSLPETYYRAVNVGSPIKVYIREFPGRTFIGQMERSAGAIDQTTRTLLTEISLPNSSGTLVPGMYAQVEIPSGGIEKTLRVPSEAFTADSQGTRVALVDATNHLHWQKVEIGRDFGTQVEILSGIKAGDRLVDNPSDLLTDGELVTPVEPKSQPQHAQGQPSAQPAQNPGLPSTPAISQPQGGASTGPKRGQVSAGQGSGQ